MTPKDSIENLEKLTSFGFDDALFNIVHHYREPQFVTEDDKISYHTKYCRGIGRFRPGDRNETLAYRLEFIRATYESWKLPPGKREVLKSLAEAAHYGIRPDTE